MMIRKAENKDAKEIICLLKQVLEVHAKIRPDIFISGTAKYTVDEVISIINDESRRSFVAEENGKVLGYALCELKLRHASNNVKPCSYIYIDDLCVDEKTRRRHIAAALFDRVKKEAKELGCREITLNVWEGNENAKAFYAKMGMKPRKTTMEIKTE